jgi:hypothetical protein
MNQASPFFLIASPAASLSIRKRSSPVPFLQRPSRTWGVNKNGTVTQCWVWYGRGGPGSEKPGAATICSPPRFWTVSPGHMGA